MKTYKLISLLLLVAGATLQAQTYCKPILDKAIFYFENDTLDKSLAEVQNLEICDHTNLYGKQRTNLIEKIYEAIVEQKDQALKDKADAMLNAKRAKKASIRADSSANVARFNEKMAINARDSIALQKRIADSIAILAESRRLAQLSTIIAESGDTPSNAFCLAYEALALGWDSLTQTQSYGAFGDALYEFSELKTTIKEHQTTTDFSTIHTLPTQQKLLTVSSRNLVQLWDFKGTILDSLSVPSNFILKVGISLDGQFAVICNDDGSVILWDLNTYFQKPLVHHRQEVLGCTFHPTKPQFLTWSRDSMAILWSLDGIVLDTFTHDAYVYQANFSSDGEHLITRCANNSFTHWELTPKKKITSKQHLSYIHHINFHPTTQQILSCSSDSTTILWNTTDSLNLKHPSKVLKGNFSNKGNMLVTQSRDSLVRIWNTKTGKPIKTIPHVGMVTAYAFSNDDSLLVSGSKGKDAYIWNIAQDSIIAIRGDTTAIEHIVISEDNQYILTQTQQKAILWNRNGIRLMTLKHTCDSPAQISSNSSHIITSPNSKSIEITPNPMNVFNELYQEKKSPCRDIPLSKQESYRLLFKTE